MYTDRIGQAIEIAAICHENQYRKNPERKIPFVSHVIAVGMMLAQCGYPEDVVIAGILHDIVEDTEMTIDEIGEEFGDHVASLVEAVSEQDKSLPWEERKARFIEQLRGSSEEAKAISCCGVTHNMKTIIHSLQAGANVWQELKRGKDQQLDQFKKLLAIFKTSLNNEEVVGEYEATLERLKALGRRL
ncbi:HD domain-containing protein [Acidobacteria bacterium AH-259-A15]|nr:HD domain-containing protein [Acidobacteria bacterium AH-259-A15]